MEKIKAIKFDKKRILIFTLIGVIFLLAAVFVSHNEEFYKDDIAKVVSVSNENYEDKIENNKTEPMTKQYVTCILQNGVHKGESVELENTTSYTNLTDLNLKEDDEVFLKLTEDDDSNIISAKITEYKRDKYLVYITLIFAAVILLVGKLKGLKSIISLLINIAIVYAIVILFTKGVNIILLSVIGSLLFVFLSIYIVAGKGIKSISAICGTIFGTLSSMLIAVIVIKINNYSGIHFEEMEFLTHPPEKIFIAELIIGTLGGIMDVAISVASAVNELFTKNPDMEMSRVIKSARQIGQDIMGTMSNTLVFAYLGGSIPILVLLLRNSFPFTYIININLSLEFVRAIVGSIGIVLSIPITLFVSVFIIKKTMKRGIER